MNKSHGMYMALMQWNKLCLQVGNPLAHGCVKTESCFPPYWSYVRGIYRSPVDSPHKRPARQSFDVDFVSLNKLLNSPGFAGWEDIPLMWRHCYSLCCRFLTDVTLIVFCRNNSTPVWLLSSCNLYSVFYKKTKHTQPATKSFLVKTKMSKSASMPFG